jgi:PBP1b-binding outer membrane lipoprotein LpoB
MQRYISRILSAIAVLALLTGCAASPPVQEMSDARQAIMAAEESGAHRYATAPLTAAHTLIESAEAKLDEQDYRGARVDAVSAHSRAVEARVLARSRLSRAN